MKIQWLCVHRLSKNIFLSVHLKSRCMIFSSLLVPNHLSIISHNVLSCVGRDLFHFIQRVFLCFCVMSLTKKLVHEHFVTSTLLKNSTMLFQGEKSSLKITSLLFMTRRESEKPKTVCR